MTSREIAELTGKAHKHVLTDIRTMLDQLGMASDDFSANLPDGYGRPQAAFSLPKDLTMTLVSGYNVVMRHRIVTRWQALEVAPQLAAPQVLLVDGVGIRDVVRTLMDIATLAIRTQPTQF